MLNGLYKAAAGMKVRLAAQDVIANNLANAGTSGFQREIALVQARHLSSSPLAGRQNLVGRPTLIQSPTQPPLEQLETRSESDARPGVLHQTGVATDVALDGSGYLVLQTGGGPRLIRGGSLRANAQGHLATTAGDPLQGTDGRPLTVGDKPWHVAPDGSVTAGGAPVGRLRLVQPEGPLRHEGSALLSTGALQEAPAGTIRVLQGVLERSNVDPVREMVDMIAGFRAYEASQRAVVAQDQTLQNLFEVVKQR